MDQIDTRNYHEFTIDKNYFCGDCIPTRGNQTRTTCSDLFERQYVHMRKKSFPCVKVQLKNII